MLLQLDMTVEANNLVRFRANFSDRPDVVFPRPFLELTSSDVLVETLEHGVPIREYTAYRGFWSDAIARIGISAFLEMTLVHNFVVAARMGARVSLTLLLTNMPCDKLSWQLWARPARGHAPREFAHAR